MKQLTVYKKLEQIPMVGPFTASEALLTIAFAIFLTIAISIIDFYIYSIGLLYMILIPSSFLALATSAKVHIQAKGIDIFEFLLSKRYPKSLDGGTFEIHKEQNYRILIRQK